MYYTINELQIKNSRYLKQQKRADSNLRLKRVVSFVYLKIMNFKNYKYVVDTVFWSIFLKSVSSLMYDKHVIHRSHMTGEISRYAHGFCNCRPRENKSSISMIAHNLLGFDFLFLLKGTRLSF